MEADILKFRTKETNKGAEYNELNSKMKERMVLARSEHDCIMDEFVISLIVTQVIIMY
jgi:hypothetical protein